MIDPLTEVVALLQPQALFAKVVNGAGAWRIRRTKEDDPFYCVIVEGTCLLSPDGLPTVLLREGDFVLALAGGVHTVSSGGLSEKDAFNTDPVEQPNGEFRVGEQVGPADVRFLVGKCVFDSPDSGLLISLLPRLIHIRDDRRLAMIVKLVVDETRSRRPARDVVLPRLLEVMLIEAIRYGAGDPSSTGLVCALADDRIAAAIREIHETPGHAWTVPQMARVAALSRSMFYERFSGSMGIAPMEYLFLIRMALAKKLLRDDADQGLALVAERVGYGSTNSFSVAFARHVGLSPARYARQWQGDGRTRKVESADFKGNKKAEDI